MKTILYVENGRGVREPLPVRSTQGLSLFNANGDYADSSTGFKYAIDTMSFIKSEVTAQKFYKVPFADFMPVAAGRGNFAEDIFTNVSFSNAGDFASGVIATGANTRIASVDAAVSKVSQAVRLWAKQLNYSIPEIEQALQANNWDPIMAKEQARKENFDLGLQEVSFLGLKGDGSIRGLLNQTGVTIDTALITAPISGLSAANLQAFVAALIQEYFTATNSTTMPTKFVIPMTDFIALGGVLVPGTVGTYPVQMLKYLEDAFRMQTQNPNFQIKGLAYCDAARNTEAGINKQIYALYNDDPRTMQMELPVPYTTTAVNSINNFSFQNVGYGRFSGLGVFRQLEVLYFRY